MHENKKALVIDGNSMFYRMYYATMNQVEYALNQGWTPNNAIKLMLNTVIKLLGQNHYDYCLIAFDAHEPTFRHELLETYKEGRDKTPDELYKQMQDTIIALEAMGITTMAIPKIEADDLVGSCAHLMAQQNIHTDVYSSDKDLLQLVSQHCTVHLMKTGISNIASHTPNNFKDLFFGLEPLQVIDYKAIIGDSSDCLPGVKGIGPKTGVDLIIKYGSLENVYDHLDELSSSQQAKFNESKEIAFKCKKMATILTNVFDDKNISEFAIKKLDANKLEPIIDKYKLKDLTNYIQLRAITD